MNELEFMLYTANEIKKEFGDDDSGLYDDIISGKMNFIQCYITSFGRNYKVYNMESEWGKTIVEYTKNNLDLFDHIKHILKNPNISEMFQWVLDCDKFTDEEKTYLSLKYNQYRNL